MTEPKVSERMQTLITRAFESTHCYECTCDGEKNPTIETRDRLTLVSAIAEIEQRAEKWKEAGVALYQCSRELADIGCKDFALTNNRLDAAIAALGDEWDEAMR